MPSELTEHLCASKQSDSFGKTVILSLIDHRKYTIDFTAIIFNCSKYLVKRARKWKLHSVGIEFPTKNEIKRNKLDIYKCEHLLDYFFTSGLMQDVAYGITKLKYDSGGTKTIPHAILTAKYSHVIASYIQRYRESQFEAKSERTLFRLLQQLKPSQRHSLAGLDDIIADGINGFSVYEKVVNLYLKDKNLIDLLETGKRYLKIQYPVTCKDENSSFMTHNPTFALSDTTNQLLVSSESNSVNPSVCLEFLSLIRTLQTIENQIKSTVNNKDVIYDVNNAIKCIIKCMKHQVRDTQQKKVKTDAFNDLDKSSAFWLQDFAQKVLPVKFREGQREYFGERGMTLHVHVFFVKKDSEV